MIQSLGKPIQGGAKVGLHLFVWKIIQLTNNNTRINWALCTHNCKPALPHPVHAMDKTQYTLFLRFYGSIFSNVSEFIHNMFQNVL